LNFLGYIYELDEAPKTKIQFPSNEKQELGLVQHFLVFQIFIPLGTPFSLEVVITDTSNVNTQTFIGFNIENFTRIKEDFILQQASRR